MLLSATVIVANSAEASKYILIYLYHGSLNWVTDHKMFYQGKEQNYSNTLVTVQTLLDSAHPKSENTDCIIRMVSCNFSFLTEPEQLVWLERDSSQNLGLAQA